MNRRPLWYGWWVLVISTAAITLESGALIFGFSVFFVPIVQEFGWSRAAAAAGSSLARLESGIFGPLEGFLIDRLGARRSMLVGIPIFGLGFILMSQMHTLIEFYAIYIICFSFAASLGFFNSCSAAVANWFIRRRSLALGIMSSGIGIGTLLVPGVTWLINEHGWRNAAIVIGITTWIVGIPLALMMRHRPEDSGDHPDGDMPMNLALTESGIQSTAQPATKEVAISGRQAIRMPTFWILAFSFALRLMATAAVSLHMFPFMVDIGIPPELAGIMTTALGVLGIFGRLGYGWLGIHWGEKRTYAMGLISLLIGFLVLAFTTSIVGVIVSLVFYAPAYGGLATQMLVLRGRYFGRRSFATIGGFMAPVLTLGTITGPIYAGWLYDTSGSYRVAFMSFASLMLVALVLLWVLPRPPNGLARA